MPHVITKEAFSFDELSADARERAINDQIQFLLEVGPDDYPGLKEAIAEAERLQTPWFAGAILWEKSQNVILEDFKENNWDFDIRGNII